MKRLKPTTQYRKDYKRFRNNPKKLAKLFNILSLLQNEKPIPLGKPASFAYWELCRLYGVSHRGRFPTDMV